MHVILNEPERHEGSLLYPIAIEFRKDFSLLSSLKMIWLGKS